MLFHVHDSSPIIRSCPTAGVTRWWAGRGDADLTEPTSSHENRLKTRRPTSRVNLIKIARERSFFPKETAQRSCIDKVYCRNGRSRGRTTQWRHAQSQSRGAPWSPVKLIYP